MDFHIWRDPFNGVIESLDDIYSQNSTGWLFVVHAKATEFIYLSWNGNFKIFQRSESNPKNEGWVKITHWVVTLEKRA